MKHLILQSQFGPGIAYWNCTYQISTLQDDNYFLWSRLIVLKVMILLAVPSPSASPFESINEEACTVWIGYEVSRDWLKEVVVKFAVYLLWELLSPLLIVA